MNYNDIWGKAQAYLKNELPGHAISAWFDPVEPIGLSENKILLEVPNQFFVEWIDSHYDKQLRSSLKSINGVDYGFRFIINSNSTEISVDKTTFPQKQTRVLQQNNINKLYRFDNFIEGGNNEFAKNAAFSVANNPGENGFNPLIIYGGVGLGKTHLMHAIGNQAIELNNHLNVVIVTSEKFTLDFVNGLRKNKTIEFAQKYRKADILLIDDIQFFRGKEQTQEQFFHTFNDLYTAGKQIVMTADRYPGEMVGLQDRLLSRFESGLHADIQPPDFETRVAILSTKAKQNNMEISGEHLEKIASHVRTNIRDLESCITKIFAHTTLSGDTVNESLVESIIRERLGDQGYGQANMQDVVSGVCSIFSVSQEEIVGQSRRKNIAQARQVAAYLAREVLDMPLSAIGVHLGGRDHTTIMHAHKKVAELLKKDNKFKRRVDIIYNELNLN